MSLEGVVRSGVLDMSKISDYGARGFHFHQWLADMIVEHRIGFLVCEACVAKGFAAYVLDGLSFTAQTVAYAHDIKRKTVAPTTLKKWATGSGKANKQDMMDAAVRLGFTPVDDNEADAQILLSYTLELAA